MRRRILQGTILLWAFAITVATIVAASTLQYQLTAEKEQHLRSIAAALASNIKPDENDAQELANRLSWETGGLRVSIFSNEGVPLGDSSADLSLYEDTDVFAREEMRQARNSGMGFSSRQSDTMGQRMMFAAAKTANGFYIRIADQSATFWEGLWSVMPPLLLGLSVATLISVPFTIRFASSIQRPILELDASLAGVMDKRTKLDPGAYTYPSLQKMAGSINQLSAEIDDGLLRLEREHNKLEALLANMNEGFVLLDSNNKLLLINDTACQILGCPPLAAGSNLTAVSRNLLLMEAVADVKKTGQVRRIEMETADGGVYEATISATRPEQEQQAGGIVLLLSDITDKRSTAKLRQEFFQSASHELKTPITSIRGFAELLAGDSLIDDDRRQECAERICKEAKRMQNLIEDIMMISRMESGELAYERTVIDFNEIVKEQCNDVQSIAWDYGIDLSYEGESCVLNASRRELEELTGNLISNALKYNKLGGRIEVKLYKQDGAPILSVFNTGDAIPMNATDRIFDRFYRLDKGRSKSMGGTGLGLAIVKHVAGRYNASIKVIPHEGVGNTFRVTFPASW